MPIAYKVLGQSVPQNNANWDLYTVPANTQTIVSSISVTNTLGSSATFRIFIRPDAAAAGVGNALYYDATLAANSTIITTAGLTVDAGDVISVRSSSGGQLTFQAFGSEVTP